MPHHTCSGLALIGGSNPLKPGEISLAHNGVLFLGEFAEFKPKVLKSLREPLEAGAIVISWAASSIELPCQFQLIAAMRPCPCSYYNHPHKQCMCDQRKIKLYQDKLSSPLV